MAIEVLISEKKCNHQLIRAIVADGLGNLYEKHLTPEELEIVFHRFESIGNVYHLPREILIFVYADLIDCQSAKSEWEYFIGHEKPNDHYKLSQEDKQEYAHRYNALRDRNGWTDEWLNSFVQTGIYFEPDIDWDA